jgi:hypothetical protein
MAFPASCYFSVRGVRHVLWCRKRHRHSAPKCCTMDCPCRRETSEGAAATVAASKPERLKS